MIAADRQRVRQALDHRARVSAAQAGLMVDVDPSRTRYCEAVKTFGAERCSRQARPGSRFCGVHKRGVPA